MEQPVPLGPPSHRPVRLARNGSFDGPDHPRALHEETRIARTADSTHSRSRLKGTLIDKSEMESSSFIHPPKRSCGYVHSSQPGFPLFVLSPFFREMLGVVRL